MGKTDPRVDAYIAKSADFARPILEHIRKVVHAACPDVEETMKWSFPHFDYKGMMCSMASFKEHCALSFWKGSLILGEDGQSAEKAMGQFGRITSLKDLPSKKILTGYVKTAMKLNDEGVPAPGRTKPKAGAAELDIPDYFAAALESNPRAESAFESFTPGKRKEYITWITEAKSEQTRQRRMGTAVEWIAEGKSRNWKYEKVQESGSRESGSQRFDAP
jgi:uncharacterized protein YdeI (YjbR/CyaY-like superfamily)